MSRMRPFLKELFTVALIIKYDISTFSPVFKRISFLRLDINVMIPQNMLQWDTILAARSAPAHDNFALKWLISAASMRDRSRVYVPLALCRVLLLFPASLISVLQGHVPTSVRLLLTDVGVCRGNGKPKSCQFKCGVNRRADLSETAVNLGNISQTFILVIAILAWLESNISHSWHREVIRPSQT